MLRRSPQYFTALLITAFIGIGCTAAPAATPTDGATPPASSAEQSEPVASTSATPEVPALEPETTQLSIGGSIAGVSWLPVLITAETLRADGWEIEFTDFASGDLVVQAVAAGDVNLGGGAMAAMMLAQAQDAPIKMIFEQLTNQWNVHGKAEFATCESLHGVKYAVHSYSSLSYLFPVYWIEQECPGTVPEWIILPGSENRMAAMLTGEIDATSMELSDSLTLEAEGDAFTKITNFNESLPGIVTGAYFGNTEFMEANPNTIALFIAAVVEEYRALMADSEYFAEQLRTHMPEITNPDEIAEVYVEEGMFHVDGGITDEAMAESVEFYASAEIIPTDMTVDDIVDRSYLDAALEQLGAS